MNGAEKGTRTQIWNLSRQQSALPIIVTRVHSMVSDSTIGSYACDHRYHPSHFKLLESEDSYLAMFPRNM